MLSSYKICKKKSFFLTYFCNVYKNALFFNLSSVKGFTLIRQHKLITLPHILEIQSKLEQNRTGLKTLANAKLLSMHKLGRSNYYVNEPLVKLFLNKPE
jgi:hypothetical protein